MRSIILLALIVFTLQISATHVRSARIRYEYVGDSTGINHQYKIILNIYRGLDGIPLWTSQYIKVKSSCRTFLATISLDTVYSSIPDYENCANGSMVIDNWQYSGLVILSNCTDWSLTWVECCRPHYFDNLVLNQVFYVSISLNTLLGPNNSAVAEKPHPKVFCTNKEFFWKRSYIDSDGDSIYIEYANIRNSDTTFSLFEQSYDDKAPLDVDNVVGYNVDNKTGDITFKPVSIGDFYLGFRIVEYRLDTIYQMYIAISERYEETFVTISNRCNIIGSLNISPVDTLIAHCGDKKVRFQTEKPYFVNSLHHTDFSFIRPSGVPNPTISANPDIVYAGMSDSIILDLHYPILKNGVYRLVSRYGFDGNTLKYDCGAELKLFDTLYYVVTDCSGIGVKEQNNSDFVRVYPVPAENVLNIENIANENTSYQLLNTKGVVCLKGESNDKDKTSIDVSDLSQGMYVIMLLQEDKFQTESISIVK